MPSSDESVEIPSQAAAIAQRYLRIERPAIALGAVVTFLVVVITLVVFPLVQALFVVIAVLVLYRLPLFRADGSVELVTDAGPDSVKSEFESAIPPTLALTWGLADSVRRTEDGGRYEVSYLFGLRSVIYTIEIRQLSSGEEFELVVTENDKPWMSYTVTIRDRGGKTSVTIDGVSDRGFALRRAPQWLVAKQFRDKTLDAQGYTVVERTESVHF